MKKISALIVCLLFCISSYCHCTVRLNITQLPGQPKTNVIFTAGSFNNWTPNDEDNKFQQGSAGNFFLNYPRVDSGTYEFKFTRGSWQTVECKKNGADIENRIMTIKSDTVLNFSIESWKDEFMQEPRKHTVSKQDKCTHYRFCFLHSAIKQTSSHLDLSSTGLFFFRKKICCALYARRAKFV